METADSFDRVLFWVFRLIYLISIIQTLKEWFYKSARHPFSIKIVEVFYLTELIILNIFIGHISVLTLCCIDSNISDFIKNSKETIK